MILKQFVTSLETVFVNFYQYSIDTTFYQFCVGKVSPLKKMRRLSKMHLLQDVRKIIDLFKRFYKPKLFFQRISCSCKENKTFVSARKQLYENEQYKNSSELIPDTHTNIYLETVYGEHHRIPRYY